MKWFKEFLNFLFPSFCKLCGKPLLNTEVLVCKDCFSQLPVLKHYCKKCGNPLKIEKTRDKLNYCSYCEEKKLLFDKVLVLFEYTSPVKNWILEFKFKENFVLAFTFGKLLGKIFKSEVETSDYIIPVPVYSEKQKQRGYNQTYLIALGIDKRKLLPDFLIKTKETLPQSSLSFKERWKNLKGVFKLLSEEKVKGKKILLVDDVITTGATLNECAGVLKKAGVEKVKTLAIAKTTI